MQDKKGLKRAILIFIAMIFVIVVVLITLVSTLKNGESGLSQFAGVLTPSIEDEETSSSSEEVEVIEEQNVYTESYIIRLLVSNSWSRIDNTIMSYAYEIDENGNYVYEDGFVLYSDNGTYVKNIVFNLDYEDEIVGGLRVGATYDEVTESMGTPMFEDKKTGIYGYKTDTIYVFFYDDEISVYPNANLLNSSFEKLLFEYVEGDYDGRQTNFVVEMKNTYDDITATADGEDVILSSLNRQVSIRLNGTAEETEVSIYNGYSIGTLMQEYLDNESENIIDEREDDLIFLTEIERVTETE